MVDERYPYPEELMLPLDVPTNTAEPVETLHQKRPMLADRVRIKKIDATGIVGGITGTVIRIGFLPYVQPPQSILVKLDHLPEPPPMTVDTWRHSGQVWVGIDQVEVIE